MGNPHKAHEFEVKPLNKNASQQSEGLAAGLLQVAFLVAIAFFGFVAGILDGVGRIAGRILNFLASGRFITQGFVGLLFDGVAGIFGCIAQVLHRFGD